MKKKSKIFSGGRWWAARHTRELRSAGTRVGGRTTWAAKMKFKKRYILLGILVLIFLVGLYNSFKPLPEGISFDGEYYNIGEDDVGFLYDLTYEDDGERIYDHKIFDSVFETIDEAERYILIDMFLWSTNEESRRDLGRELSDHLIEKKKDTPEIEIVVISDPFNDGYGSFDVDYFEDMKDVGIEVVITDLNPLRDSNFIYSSIWRSFFWILGEPGKGWVKIPGMEEKSSVRAFLKLLNFKANHRKTMIADCGETMCSYVISANPSGSGADHSNVGFKVRGELYKDLFRSEASILRLSGAERPNWDFDFVDSDNKGDVKVRLVTEGKIKESVLEEIGKSVSGDEIKLAMFYFSDRDIVDALLEASERGVDIEIVVDPSKTGFGRDKFGVPSRMVADELVEKSNGKIEVRYYDTEEEQFHSKMIVFVRDDEVVVILGSGNYTRRNMDDLNLEADLAVRMPADSDLALEILGYFRKVWENDGGEYTVNFDSFEEPSLFRNLQYRFLEWSGMGTF